jgi:hypothetical protein
MPALFATYAVSVFAMLFAASSAATLIYTVNHFDPPEPVKQPERLDEIVAA